MRMLKGAIFIVVAASGAAENDVGDTRADDGAIDDRDRDRDAAVAEEGNRRGGGWAEVEVCGEYVCTGL
jgi:hypothetical protein